MSIWASTGKDITDFLNGSMDKEPGVTRLHLFDDSLIPFLVSDVIFPCGQRD